MLFQSKARAAHSADKFGEQLESSNTLGGKTNSVRRGEAWLMPAGHLQVHPIAKHYVVMH